jgi:NADH:ubiquinone oxidoreductase subunit K
MQMPKFPNKWPLLIASAFFAVSAAGMAVETDELAIAFMAASLMLAGAFVVIIGQSSQGGSTDGSNEPGTARRKRK